LAEITVAVLGKNIWGEGGGPSSFGRQQRLSEITIEPIKNWGAGQDLGACALAPTWNSHWEIITTRMINDMRPS